MNDYKNIEVATTDSLAKNKQEMSMSTPGGSGSAMENVSVAREVSEVQAALVVAQHRPRNELKAIASIAKTCARVGFAENAEFAYRRGGNMIIGPTIRLLEAIATKWGNLDFGFKVVRQTATETEVEAYAWDLENNTKVRKCFAVQHVREKRGGNVALTSDRDKYELIANMSQRRVRACLESIIPRDVIDEAREQCKKTMESGEVPFEDTVRDLTIAFEKVGVTIDMLEQRLQHPLSAMVPQQLPDLRSIYNSLKTGMGKREDYFEFSQFSTEVASEETKGEPTKAEKPSKKASTPKEKKKDAGGPGEQKGLDYND